MARELRSIKFPGLDEPFQIPQPTVFEININNDDKNHLDTLNDLNAESGDVAILIDSDSVKYRYQFNDGKWISFDGKIDAKDIIFRDGITVAGDFGCIGNLKPGEKFPKNTTLNDIIRKILENRLPSEITDPSVHVKFDCDLEQEVGKIINIKWSTHFDPGKYSFGPETGVKLGRISLADSENGNYVLEDGDEGIEISGEIENFEVTPDLNFYFVGSFTHSRGCNANDSLGNPDEFVFIDEEIKPVKSDVITSYYPVIISIDDTERHYKFTGNNNFTIQTAEGTSFIKVMYPMDFGNIFVEANMLTNGHSFNITELFEKEENITKYNNKEYCVWKYSPDFFGGSMYNIAFKEVNNG